MNLRYCQVNNAIPRNEVIWFKFAFDNYTKVYVNITERESYVNVYGLTFDWMSSFFSSVLFKPAYAILNPFWRDLKWCTYTCTCGNVISVFGAYHFKWFEWPWIYTLHILRCFTEDMPFCTLGACTYTLNFFLFYLLLQKRFQPKHLVGARPGPVVVFGTAISKHRSTYYVLEYMRSLYISLCTLGACNLDLYVWYHTDDIIIFCNV